MKNNKFVYTIVALFTCFFAGCAVQTINAPQTPGPENLSGQGGYCLRRGPNGQCLPPRNSVAAAGNTYNNGVHITFGGGGGYRPAPALIRNDCADTQIGGRIIGGGIRMARCNHCGWSGRWEIRQQHPCNRQGGMIVSGSGYNRGMMPHQTLNTGTTSNGWPPVSEYYRHGVVYGQ